MLTRAERITNTLDAGLELAHLEVIDESHNHSVPDGAESHFKVVAVAAQFDGLSRINLMQTPFEVYRKSSLSVGSISSNYVTALEIASDNGLWVGTYGTGLNYLDLETGLFTS